MRRRKACSVIATVGLLTVASVHARLGHAVDASGVEPGVKASELQVVPVVFTGKGRMGDYAWMRNQAGYERAYFVFNDNEEQFLLHQGDIKNGEGCSAGGGNAVIRPWQCETPPRAGGIPTGSSSVGGYRTLTPEVAKIIDAAIVSIWKDVKTYHYVKIVYSSCIKGSTPNCTLDNDLGTGIFSPSEDVRQYIISNLKNINFVYK